jgi:hypothetical protein
MSSGINPRRKQWLLTPLHRGLLRGDAAVDDEHRAPVIKAASSEARNTMPLAISSGVPMRSNSPDFGLGAVLPGLTAAALLMLKHFGDNAPKGERRARRQPATTG